MGNTSDDAHFEKKWRDFKSQVNELGRQNSETPLPEIPQREIPKYYKNYGLWFKFILTGFLASLIISVILLFFNSLKPEKNVIGAKMPGTQSPRTNPQKKIEKNNKIKTKLKPGLVDTAIKDAGINNKLKSRPKYNRKNNIRKSSHSSR